jgi:hypothetical protein
MVLESNESDLPSFKSAEEEIIDTAAPSPITIFIIISLLLLLLLLFLLLALLVLNY